MCSFATAAASFTQQLRHKSGKVDNFALLQFKYKVRIFNPMEQHHTSDHKARRDIILCVWIDAVLSRNELESVGLSHSFSKCWKASSSSSRQINDFDFRKLPDPFGAYRNQLNPLDLLSKYDKGLSHIKDPEMHSLMKREITKWDLGFIH